VPEHPWAIASFALPVEVVAVLVGTVLAGPAVPAVPAVPTVLVVLVALVALVVLAVLVVLVAVVVEPSGVTFP